MFKGKPVIGILATSNYLQTDDPFKDTYRYGNNYIKKIVDNGGIPYLIPYVDDTIIEESLELCDGLLLPGGNRVMAVGLKVVDYFYNCNKPILGICLGMQTLGMYSVNIDREESKKILMPVENPEKHWPVDLVRDNIDTLAHKVFVSEDSKLYDIFKSKELMVNSVHKYTIKEVGDNFKISISSEDGLIEGIEYKGKDKFVVGVQFHPEVLNQYNNLFEKFINECKK